MNILSEKIWNFLSRFVDSDGAFDYMISIDGNSIVIKSCNGIITNPVLSYFVNLKSEMSEFIDCGFYVTTSDGFVTLKFYIKKG